MDEHFSDTAFNLKGFVWYQWCKSSVKSRTKLKKFNLVRPSSLTFIHNYFEILNIIETLQNDSYDKKLLSQYSKLTNLNELKF